METMTPREIVQELDKHIVGQAAAKRSVAIALTGVGERPYRAEAVEAAILAGAPFADAVAGVASGQRVLGDPYADRDYRAAMAVLVTRRALERAARG